MTTDERIIIKETVDGSPAATATITPKDGVATATPRNALKPRRKADPYILGIYLVFFVISIIEIFSASSTEVRANDIYGPLKRHAMFLLGGGLIVYAMQKINYGYLRQWAWPIALMSLLLLVVASFFGANINGAQRAIMIGSFTIQPAEIVKFTVVLLLARVLGNNQLAGGVATKGIITAAIVVVVFSGILWKNGLTNMILLMGVSVAMFLIGGIQWKKLGVVFIIYGCCGGMLIWAKYTGDKHDEFDRVETATVMNAENEGPGLFDGREKTHKSRLANYTEGVEPTDPITDDNRQVYFASMAQAHGGIIGRGPGNSRESARLPLAFSDYIYSIIVEDSGLVGGIVVLVFYLFLVARAGVIAYKLKKAFPTFLIMGCAVMIVFQALVHMAIVTGVAPVSGQPLPFISKGGTSILVMSAAIGAMLSVSRFAEYRNENITEKRKSRRSRKTTGKETLPDVGSPVMEEPDGLVIA